MNEVSIIINGVRYDAVRVEGYVTICEECDLCEECTGDNLFGVCSYYLNNEQVFKKSDKKFEK